MKLLNFVVLSLLTTTAAGCGNLITSPSIREPASSYTIAATPTSITPDTNPLNYSCPSEPNITPANGNAQTSELSFYRICADNVSTGTNGTQILLQATVSRTGTGPGSQLCVFAANQMILSANQVTPQISVSWLTEPGNPKAPLYRCASLKNEQAFISFPSTGTQGAWNSAYIVTGNNVSQMTKCLLNNSATGGNTMANCPPYSYGQF